MARSRVLRIAGQRPPFRGTALAVLFLLTAAAAGIGAWASIQAGEFYALLVRPAWAPPAWLFGPVWSLLYVLMAIASWLAFRAGAGFERALPATALYVGQLVLNALWTWLFFRWHLGGLALFEVCLLWLMILATLTQFWRLSRVAGMLLVPYLLWVSFATALNAACWQLNPGIL
jgi:tryptophan-rich sensory protein